MLHSLIAPTRGILRAMAYLKHACAKPWMDCAHHRTIRERPSPACRRSACLLGVVHAERDAWAAELVHGDALDRSAQPSEHTETRQRVWGGQELPSVGGLELNGELARAGHDKVGGAVLHAPD